MDDVPDDLLLVIRATPSARGQAIEAIAEDASRSARGYVVGPDRELLFGASVFAHRPGVRLTDVMERFPAAPAYLEAPVGVIRAAGFAVLATGSDRDHFDVQLVGGIREDSRKPTDAVVHAAAARLLRVAGELQPNPSYAGRGDNPGQEDR